MRGLTEAFDAELRARLSPTGSEPLIVGVSGGGDSVALLALTCEWARPRDLGVLALTVDHGLDPDSAEWSRLAASVAARLGAAHAVLPWIGPKPRRGLPAAARQARHALLAEAARAHGASVILLGHTADDRIESAHMRAAGVPLGELRSWAPSPVWPEGRGVMLLRPLLAVRRATLRDWLQAHDLPWIEDPANADTRYARARARQAVVSDCARPHSEAVTPSPLLRVTEVTSDGRIVAPRPSLRAAPDLRRFVAAAVACAGGTNGDLRRHRLDRLIAGLQGAEPLLATLGGARVHADEDRVTFARNAGEAERGGLGPVPLSRERAVVWDGRFEAPATELQGSIVPLRGRTAGLPARQRDALRAIPSAARPALPVVLTPDGEIGCPLLEPGFAPRLHALVGARLAAALGGTLLAN